jgi:hypothetical protein
MSEQVKPAEMRWAGHYCYCRNEEAVGSILPPCALCDILGRIVLNPGWQYLEAYSRQHTIPERWR